MSRRLPCAVALATAGSLIAQSITVAVPTSTAITAQAGANQQTTPVPAGPLAAQGNLAAYGIGPALSNSAELSWFTQSSAGSMELSLSAMAGVASVPGLATVGPVDMIASLVAPSPLPVRITLTRTILGSPGTTMPFARVDVADDGSFELDENSTQNPYDVYVVIGPTPLPVRCRISADVDLAGSLTTVVQVTVRPANTVVHALGYHCSDAAYFVTPRFDGNVQFGIDNVFAGSALAVFGLAAQPLLLGTSLPQQGSPSLPCVLLPRPDLLVFLPTPQPLLLSVPPAVRPIVIETQSVQLLPFSGWSTGLGTSTAYRILAF